jgi:short-subunit dehydrogenase
LNPTESRKVAVVTGACTGIGLEIAAALAAAGWDLAITCLPGTAEAEQVADDLRRRGANVLLCECDAGIKREVDPFYARLKAWRGAPDLLVNNAGVQTRSALLDLSEADWDRVIQTNLKGCFLNTQAAARLMVERGQGGAIVNLGSGCNKLAFPGLVDYTASRGGIEQFTKVSAVELGPQGIRVNCVAPGAIETARTRRELPEYGASWARITPLRRIGTAQDIPPLVLFLASPGAAFITGQTIWVDGGVFSQANWPAEP